MCSMTETKAQSSDPKIDKPTKAGEEQVLVRTRQGYKKTILIALMVVVVPFVGHQFTSDFENVFFFWIFVFIIGALYVIYRVIKRYTTLYTLTTSYIQEESGLLNRKVVKIPLSRITNYLVERSLIDRILELGTLNIDTPGSHGFELVLVNIPNDKLAEFTSNLDKLLKEVKAEKE